MSYCEKCGTEVPENARFCPVCGYPQNPEKREAGAGRSLEEIMAAAETSDGMKAAEEKVEKDFADFELNRNGASYTGQDTTDYGEAVFQVEAPVPEVSEVSVRDQETTKSILVFGILGVSFGFTFITSFLGIIFGSVALKKSNVYMAEKGITALSGRAKVGHILAKAGVISGIICTILFFVLLVASCSAAMLNY